MPLPVGRGRREAPGEGPNLKMLCDCFEHAGEVLHYLVIPESEHRVALGRKISRAPFISLAMRWIIVLAAVQFDYQAGIQTEEVGNVRPDRMLAAELRAFKLIVA